MAKFRQKYIISKQLFETVTGTNVIYVEVVGRLNSKRVKYLPNYMKAKTISIHEFKRLCKKYMASNHLYYISSKETKDTDNIQEIFDVCETYLKGKK